VHQLYQGIKKSKLSLSHDRNDAVKEAIERQKQRAILFWNDSEYDETVKNNVHEKVIDHLNRGMVLPIFHTFCRRPNARLFSPDVAVSMKIAGSEKIQLSPEEVTEGECALESVGKVKDIGDEKSYIPAFFTSTGAARSAVDDSSYCWKFNLKYTKAITSLVNTPATMAGEDIEVTELLVPFPLDETSGRNLITRRLSRGVTANCFLKSECSDNYTIIGSPGTGKSWTLIYALQQALLYDNACVILCFQKEGSAIVCIRRKNTINVWYRYDEAPNYSALFDNHNVLLLLDANESKRKFSNGRRMVVMAAPNEAWHFGSMGKVTPDFERFLSPYFDTELEIALPYMIEQDVPPVP
jgi:hypothetical protein